MALLARGDDRAQLTVIQADIASMARLLDRMHQEFHTMSDTVSESHTAILKLQADHNDFKLALADRLSALQAQIAALKVSIVPGLNADDLAMVNALDTDTLALANQLRSDAGSQPVITPGNPNPPNAPANPDPNSTPPAAPAMPAGLVLDPVTNLMTDPATGETWDPAAGRMIPGAAPAPAPAPAPAAA